MYHLPPASSPLRELFTVEHLAAMGPLRDGKIPLFAEAKRGSQTVHGRQQGNVGHRVHLRLGQ